MTGQRKMNCTKCNTPTDGLLWYGPNYYCWQHYMDVTARERVRVGSLTMADAQRMLDEYRGERNDVY
jgi:hypothetical protein